MKKRWQPPNRIGDKIMQNMENIISDAREKDLSKTILNIKHLLESDEPDAEILFSIVEHAKCYLLEWPTESEQK